MFLNGVLDYDRSGKEHRTGLVAGRATGDGEVRTLDSGKQVGSVSIRACSRKDGTAAFFSVKSWDGDVIDRIAALRKGDRLLAAGRLEFREYNGKTYIDLLADFLLTQPQEPSSPAQPAFRDLAEDDGDLPF